MPARKRGPGFTLPTLWAALGWFHWFLLAEFACTVIMFISLKVVVDHKRWPRAE